MTPTEIRNALKTISKLVEKVRKVEDKVQGRGTFRAYAGLKSGRYALMAAHMNLGLLDRKEDEE